MTEEPKTEGEVKLVIEVFAKIADRLHDDIFEKEPRGQAAKGQSIRWHRATWLLKLMDQVREPLQRLSEKRCHDCGVPEGALHRPGCDMERCPFCGGQLITCSCQAMMLGAGHSPAQEEGWKYLLDEKGRIPWIQWPNLCAYCGRLWPKMFHASDEEWRRYVEPAKRGSMVCPDCWNRLKALIDG